MQRTADRNLCPAPIVESSRSKLKTSLDDLWSRKGYRPSTECAIKLRSSHLSSLGKNSSRTSCIRNSESSSPSANSAGEYASFPAASSGRSRLVALERWRRAITTACRTSSRLPPGRSALASSTATSVGRTRNPFRKETRIRLQSATEHFVPPACPFNVTGTRDRRCERSDGIAGVLRDRPDRLVVHFDERVKVRPESAALGEVMRCARPQVRAASAANRNSRLGVQEM